jgi:hypothetical protein
MCSKDEVSILLVPLPYKILTSSSLHIIIFLLVQLPYKILTSSWLHIIIFLLVPLPYKILTSSWLHIIIFLLVQLPYKILTSSWLHIIIFLLVQLPYKILTSSWLHIVMVLHVSGPFSDWHFNTCFYCKSLFPSVNISFIPVFKPHTHKLYILRHCTNIVYLFPLQHLNTVDTRFVLNANLKKDLIHATP